MTALRNAVRTLTSIVIPWTTAECATLAGCTEIAAAKYLTWLERAGVLREMTAVWLAGPKARA